MSFGVGHIVRTRHIQDQGAIQNDSILDFLLPNVCKAQTACTYTFG